MYFTRSIFSILIQKYLGFCSVRNVAEIAVNLSDINKVRQILMSYTFVTVPIWAMYVFIALQLLIMH